MTTGDLLARWCLSPRYRVASPSLRTVVRDDDGVAVTLDAEEWAALEGPPHPLPFLGDAVRGLIARKLLVPAYLAAPPEGPTLFDFYADAWTAVCAELGRPDVARALRLALADWSGTVLRQPVHAPRAYSPTRPSLSCSLGGPPHGFQLRCDCRDPLRTAEENLAYARAFLGSRLGPARRTFDQLCALVCDRVEAFDRLDIKYLHGEFTLDEPGGVAATLFWNLGGLPPGERQRRMEQALDHLETAPGQALDRSLLSAIDPELLGVRLSGPDLGSFRLAHVQRGVEIEAARPLARRLGAEAGLELVARALPGLEALGFDRRSTYLALALHRPASGGVVAVEWHLHLLASPVSLRLAPVLEVVRRLTGAPLDPFPGQFQTPAGPVRVAPRWLRFRADEPGTPPAVEMVVAFRPGEIAPA
jgi:hypothetical protein